MTNPIDKPGRVMAVDLGEKRIGIAISDPTRTIATPHAIIKRTSRTDDFAQYAALIEQFSVTLLLMGLPVTLGGQEGERAAWVRNYAEDLRGHIHISIEYWDESLTTVAATAALHAQGHRGRKVKDRVDAVAATLILQSYLDAQPGGLADGE